MKIVLKAALTITLVAIAMFCGFGFLASGESEPRVAVVFRLIYGTVALGCVAAIAAVWFKRK